MGSCHPQAQMQLGVVHELGLPLHQTWGAIMVWPWGIGSQWPTQAEVSSQWSSQVGLQVGTNTEGGLPVLGAYQGLIPGAWWPPYQAPSFSNQAGPAVSV